MMLDEIREQSSLDPEAITAQLEQLLASHHFRHSHRYPALLRYLVLQTLAGNGAQLKERLVGIEVFHRPPDYDTNAEPVVRVTAAEVRKRIAQYYHEPEHHGELRIDLPLGSYIPRFEAAVTPAAAPTPASTRAAAIVAAVNSPVAEAFPSPVYEAHVESMAPPKQRGRTGFVLALVAALLCGGLLSYGYTLLRSAEQARSNHALRSFWAPLADDSDPILIVIGNHSMDKEGHTIPADSTETNITDQVLLQLNRNSQVTISDLLSVVRLTSYIDRRQMRYHAVGANTANLDDLRKGPVLLFAALDNRWTIRLTQQLRFRFRSTSDDSIGVIDDAKNPGRTWSVDFRLPYRRLPEDFAIVARYNDPMLEQPVIIAAGVGETGSVAASEFVTEEHALESAAALAPKDWKGENMELVLKTSVVDGHPGPSHIVASEFW